MFKSKLAVASLWSFLSSFFVMHYSQQVLIARSNWKRTPSSCNAINSPLVLPKPLEPWEISWILWRLWEVYGVVNEVWQNWYFVLYANYEVFCFPVRTVWQLFFVRPCAYSRIVYFILFLSTCLKCCFHLQADKRKSTSLKFSFFSLWPRFHRYWKHLMTKNDC